MEKVELDQEVKHGWPARGSLSDRRRSKKLDWWSGGKAGLAAGVSQQTCTAARDELDLPNAMGLDWTHLDCATEIYPTNQHMQVCDEESNWKRNFLEVEYDVGDHVDRLHLLIWTDSFGKWSWWRRRSQAVPGFGRLWMINGCSAWWRCWSHFDLDCSQSSTWTSDDDLYAAD